jgi:MarR family transcriptional regulator, lower aerobic nicotinate degradation pathway regulator
MVDNLQVFYPEEMSTVAASTELSTILAALGRDATTRVRRALRPLGVGAQHYLVLTQLQDLGHTSQAELASALALDPSNLASTVAELVDRGLVDRCRDEADRRRYALTLAPAGAEVLRRAGSAIAETEQELLASLEREQQDQLYALLRRIADGIDLCPAAGDGPCLG